MSLFSLVAWEVSLFELHHMYAKKWTCSFSVGKERKRRERGTFS